MSQADPVLVMGAGPVGLSLALALIQMEIPVVVFDYKVGVPHDHLRASTVQPPTLDMFRKWGVLDDVLQVGRRVDRLQYWDWSKRALLAEFDYDLISQDTSCPFRVHLPQYELCVVLSAAIEKAKPGTLRYGHRLVSFKDFGGHVEATIEARETADTEARQSTVRGSLLCGADGTASTVREQLGVKFSGASYEDAFLTCEGGAEIQAAFAAASGREGGLADASYLFHQKEWAIYHLMPDCVRLLFRVKPGVDPVTTMTNEGLWERSRQLLGDDVEYVFRNRGVYTAQQRVAATLRVGRVTLVGDAAHSAFPVDGTAMNCGIHDAFHLAVAIEAGSGEALDAYSQRRRQVAIGRMQAHAHESYEALCAKGPWERMSRNRYLKKVVASSEAAREHLLRASLMEGGEGIPEFI